MAEKQVVTEVQPDSYASPAEERVIVRAARLRLSTDKKQGTESPSWVKEIAKRPIWVGGAGLGRAQSSGPARTP
jgi:hypothetical protein